MSGEFLAYDALPYTGEAYPQTHPGALFSAAWLLGASPADPARCRVLEVGCADATNLIAMAAGLPQATFVGIDGSPVQIAAGRKLLAEVGLDNVSLQVGDLRDFQPEPGGFDYLIAHGVYAWIAPDARAALLALAACALAPQGVAYISYNALPGWHTCRMVRELMRFHTRKFAAIPEQIAQARAVLRFAAASALGGWHAATLRSFVPYLDRIDDDYLFHDYLETHNDPMRVTDFVAAAEAAGLAYLGDSELHRMAGMALPPEVRATIEGFTDDALAQEQYLDFLTDRTLRRTLLCHPGISPRHDLQPSRAHRLAYSTGLSEVPDSAPTAFRHRRTRDTVVVTDPVHRAALRHLIAAAPRPVPYADLAAAVPGEGLEGLLLRGVLQGVIAPHADVPPVTGEVSARPTAWPLARLLASKGRAPISRLHRTVPPLNALEPAVIRRLDGTRSLADLVDALRPMVAGSGDVEAALTEAIEAALARAAREGLLVG